ncbi:hypothetical protein [Fodinibius sediminis]|uniref:Uncharacterized protein n=1 Tax=Fodinibius sediminis TaxID=1214077 RepID=A0A521BPB3_9BACT|nr:hypothetical protein [Fodinibius sediminis]SMO48939.1 hypothetical protein SAMN06265218_103266 [Fodinibius sediminis]
MKTLLVLLSIAGLALTVIPSVLVFSQGLSLETHKLLMLAGMLMWFITAPFWMKEQEL